MPLGELRRKDRAISLAESAELLDRALVTRVGTADADGNPYVVPMNFVYETSSSTVYLHCATSGHLLTNLASNPRVCLEVDEPGEVIVSGDSACDTSHLYRSAICFGQARVVSDYEEKRRILRLFVEKYVDRLMPDRQYDPALRTIDSTVAIAIHLDTITGKRRR